MISIRSILHPTDFSERSDLAFRLAGWFARDYSARIIALHVVEPQPAMPGEGGLLAPPPIELEPLQEKLNQLKTRGGKVDVDTVLTQGNAAEEILRVAKECNCDLIMMGTHGRSGLSRLLMGSVAEHVVRKAACPVLTVKMPH